MKVTVNYKDRFLETIRKASLDPAHWNEEWIFIGGSGDGSSDRYLKYFKLRYPDRCVPNYKRDRFCTCKDRICFPRYLNTCLCTQRTWENYYIENIFTKEAKVIGHCCVRRFFSKCDQLCLVCHTHPRKADSYYCSECRKYNSIDPKVARQKEEDYLKEQRMARMNPVREIRTLDEFRHIKRSAINHQFRSLSPRIKALPIEVPMLSKIYSGILNLKSFIKGHVSEDPKHKVNSHEVLIRYREYCLNKGIVCESRPQTPFLYQILEVLPELDLHTETLYGLKFINLVGIDIKSD
jgi:hypothetical protein